VNEKLAAELRSMRDVDQEFRTRARGEPFPAHESPDARHTERMKEIVHEFGWPGFRLVGDEGAQHAWLLVQHADNDVEFQRRCLTLLAAAVAGGDASARNLAYLTDRVRLNEGAPQVYGTQGTLVDGRIESRPIEDPEHVDELRAAAGLGPLEEYLELLRSRG
jgi:hypothetical protein